MHSTIMTERRRTQAQRHAPHAAVPVAAALPAPEACGGPPGRGAVAPERS